jgi:hypothetical protein
MLLHVAAWTSALSFDIRLMIRVATHFLHISLYPIFLLTVNASLLVSSNWNEMSETT